MVLSFIAQKQCPLDNKERNNKNQTNLIKPSQFFFFIESLEKKIKTKQIAIFSNKKAVIQAV